MAEHRHTNNYTITLSKTEKYIILTVYGEIGRKTAISQIIEAHALGRQLGIDRYLMNVVEARNTDSVIDQYDFAYNDVQKAEGINKQARVAVLIDPEDHSHDFIEVVARNSGLNLRLFTDIEQAKKFLSLN